MEIKKVGELTAEEYDALVSAGKVLKQIKNSFEDKSIDTLADTELLAALKEVLDAVVSHVNG